jgi:hypothetical protein
MVVIDLTREVSTEMVTPRIARRPSPRHTSTFLNLYLVHPADDSMDLSLGSLCASLTSF